MLVARAAARHRRQDEGRPRRPRSRSGCRPTSRTRIDNSSQQFGVEQMHALPRGARASRRLPAIINETVDEDRPRRASSSPTSATTPRSKRASEALVALAQEDRLAGLDRQAARARQRGQREGATINADDAAGRRRRSSKYQEQAAREGLHRDEAASAGGPSIDYCLAYAARPAQEREERARTRSPRSKARRQEQHRATSTRIFAIAKDDRHPDAVRDLALRAPRRAPEGA